MLFHMVVFIGTWCYYVNWHVNYIVVFHSELHVHYTFIFQSYFDI